MSSLHSCHWDWCRFTTVLHDDFVQHVISAHIDTAEPVKRDDISLIRHVDQGTSSHSGELVLLRQWRMPLIDPFIGDLFSSSAVTTSQPEAPQSIPHSVGSSVSLRSPLLSLLSPHTQHVSKANHPGFSKPTDTQTTGHALSFASGSTYILPVSPQAQQAAGSDSYVSRCSCFYYLASRGIKLNIFSGTEPGNFTAGTTNTGSVQIPEFCIANLIFFRFVERRLYIAVP